MLFFNNVSSFDLVVPPVVDELPHKVVPEGRAMIMTCESSGIPEPEITWLRVGQTNEYSDGIQSVSYSIRKITQC